MIDDFYTTSFDVVRQNYGTDNKSTESVVASFSGHLQKTGMRLTEQMDLNFVDTYTVWCPLDTDVEVGDTIDSGSQRYSVRNIKDLDFGSNSHKQLIVEK